MKVAIIGSGNVGSSSAQRILEANLADVVLVDIIEGKAEAIALDLSSAASIIGHSRSIVGSCNMQDIADSNIVVITAGKTRKPGQSREDLWQNNAEIIKDICRGLIQYCPKAIVIVVTNPVDVMAYLVAKITGFPKKRIVGMSGVSDCARFNMLAAAALNIKSSEIESVIIGPHSDKMLILPRLTTAQGETITKLLPAKKTEELIQQTRTFGAKIVELLQKGSAFYGPSAGVFALVDSIINGQKKTLCTCAFLLGEYGLQELYIGVPIKIGKSGVEKIIELKLNEEEKRLFLDAADSIKVAIKRLGV